MADNYLEKRYEETLGANRPKVKRIGNTVDTLLQRSRSHRGYNKNYVVSRAELERIVSVCTKLPSGCNQQVLRYWLVNKDSGADCVLPLVKMGAALPELHLPLPGTEPEAFIVCCSVTPESKLVDIDLGIALQSMALKAVEMGLNTLMSWQRHRPHRAGAHRCRLATRLLPSRQRALCAQSASRRADTQPCVRSRWCLWHWRSWSLSPSPEVCGAPNGCGTATASPRYI